jgi:aryl-alcohol dehydrogenase-like predicted oxidoreductase
MNNTQLVPLGSTGMQVVPMGIGTWAWGDTRTWGYGRTHTDADLQAAFEASLAAGINLFDTAEAYGSGQSERLLGRFISMSQQPVRVATKFVPFPWRLRKQNLLDALRASLDRLGLKQVDLYQLHFPFPPVPIETWMDGLADAVRAGLVRAAGVSNCSVEQMRRAHAALTKCGVVLASNQVEYSLLHRAPERNGLMQACRETGVTLIAYSPIRKGVLSGKYTPENRPTGTFRSSLANRDYLARVQPLIALLREIGQSHGGKTPSQVALNWVLCKGALPIPGAKNVRQAQENAGALGWQLSESEMATLDAASDKVTSK